jgi:hypothetical protein
MLTFELSGDNSFIYYLKCIINLFSYSNNIIFVSSKGWESNIDETTNIASIGNILYTCYCI